MKELMVGFNNWLLDFFFELNFLKSKYFYIILWRFVFYKLKFKLLVK